MDGRKILTRYYPPDFDPDKLREASKKVARAGGLKGRTRKHLEVRYMWPFTFQCKSCDDFNYVGTKLNARVSRSKTEDYLGHPIWYFYCRCTVCRAEIIFKTDPKNADYEMVEGGKRFYAPKPEEKLGAEVEEEEELDAMRALEEKTHTTAEEIAALEALDTVKDLNKRLLHREYAVEASLKAIRHRDAQKGLEKEQLQDVDYEALEGARQTFADREFNRKKEGMKESLKCGGLGLSIGLAKTNGGAGANGASSATGLAALKARMGIGKGLGLNKKK